MAMSTFQKVTLATCLVLCVALLLPKMLLSRGRNDAAERPEGRFPPMMHRQVVPEGRVQRAAASSFSRTHNPEAVARAKGAGTGAGTGGKSNLAGQIIPVYGFGILLYILYILFKITSKGNNKPAESRFPSVRSENVKRKITDFELAQLQDKLRETELVMENIVSNAHHSPDRVKGVTADQEESLLQQLTEITRVMQEGQLVDNINPEKKEQEDWEASADYPEEPEQQWERSHCSCHHSQQTETEAERTQADGADLDNLPEDVTGGEEAAEGADLDNLPEDVTGGGEAAEGADLDNLPEDVTGGGEAADGADLDNLPEDVKGGGEAAEGAEDLNKEREPDFTAAGEEDVGPQSDAGVNERADDVREHKERAGKIDLGVPAEDLVGVLKELDLTLKMTSVMEQEKMEDLTRTTETETSCGAVRRRNKRRRAKKASH